MYGGFVAIFRYALSRAGNTEMKKNELEVSKQFLDSVQTKEQVTGYTHSYYAYPARFSPQFVNHAIKEFSSADDLIFDPFAGGGTTLVEALVSGRSSVGFDINSLACFISETKTTLLTKSDIIRVLQWALSEKDKVNLKRAIPRQTWWQQNNYQKDLPWTLRKFIELVLFDLDSIKSRKQENFIRCALLKTGHWALNKKDRVPNIRNIKDYFFSSLDEFIQANLEMSKHVRAGVTTSIYQKSLSEITTVWWEKNIGRKPTLVITSPPYPNVHVLYHRWQIHGRKETPAPYWIANKLDGQVSSYYSMGARSQKGITDYFNKLRQIYLTLNDLLKPGGLILQLIGFSNPDYQMRRYLETLEECGFIPISIRVKDLTTDYLYREVPSRKWYTAIKANPSVAQEYLLIHKKKG